MAGAALPRVFARPPANTQQIMHPELYRAAKVAAPIKLELPDGFARRAVG